MRTMTRAEAHRPDVKKLKADWAEYLRTKSLNTTSQREAIVDAFLHSAKHVSIDDLLAQVRKKHKRVGYATVYRTLRLLVESGLASARQFEDGQTRYEVASAHHDHLICVKCSLILEFDDDAIEDAQEKVARSLGGFTVLRHKHELYALCPKEMGHAGGECPNDQMSKSRRARAH